MGTGRVWMVAHCYGFGYGLGYRIAGATIERRCGLGVILSGETD